MPRLDNVRPSTPVDPDEDGASNDLIGWDDAGQPLLDAGHAIGEANILFHKIEDDEIDAQMSKLEEQSAAAESDEAPYEDLKDEIQFGDFMNLDLRVGTITLRRARPQSR
ncbi:MAG: hypothetical protein U5R48_12555 [Gammaproteobacteria bacterium]|nr:hypothetical protein [Gammaproteobacteria bacterium]